MSPAEKIAKLKLEYRHQKQKVDKPPRPPLRCLVAEYRKRLSLSLEEVGNAIGVTKQCILSMERGRSCGIRSMIAVAKFFGVSVVDLWPDLGVRT